MARLKAPLLSLGASGQLGKTIVAATWKGVKYMREYVVPTNPNTAAQQTQRGYMTANVAAWRSYFTNAEVRAAWDRLALVLPGPLSGFNVFIRGTLDISPTDPDASFNDLITEFNLRTVKFKVVNIDDGAVGDEAGDFEVWSGDTPRSLDHIADVAIVGGEVVTPGLGDADDVKYCKIRKGGIDRSGIAEVTLIV